MAKAYDLIVIGAGPGGLVGAKLAQGLGKKVLLVEKDKPGGDCTWYGCVPSKALLHLARSKKTTNPLSKVREIRKQVYAQETPEQLQKQGLEVVLGQATFTTPHQIRVGSKLYSSRYFLLATGSRPRLTSIEGLSPQFLLTNKQIFELKTYPQELVIWGGGPIGVEMAEAFATLGSKVSLIQRKKYILSKEEPKLAKRLQKILSKKGIHFIQGTPQKGVTLGDRFELILDNKQVVQGDKLLIALGREPNLEELNLEQAKIKIQNKKLVVNEYLQTSQKHIFACGDIVGTYLFTHVAEKQAILAVKNMFLPFKKKIKYPELSWCIYTHPELAHLGLTESQAKKLHPSIRVFQQSLENLDRFVCEEETGFIKVITDKKFRLLGAHILAPRAGELIQIFSMALYFKLPLPKLFNLTYAYPSYTQVVKAIARQAYFKKLEENFFLKMLKKLFK